MREKIKIDDKVAPAALNAASEKQSGSDKAEDTPNDANVSFLFSVEAIYAYPCRTQQTKTRS
jgi:hypothetical protein